MRIVSRPLYRARQVGWALRPKVTGEERAEAREVLGDRLFPAFEGMDRADQRHCLDVYRAARRTGCEDRDVLTAALIHDCGKAPSTKDGRIRLWHRIAYVALGTVAPGLLRRLSRRPGGLRLLDSHRGLEHAQLTTAIPLEEAEAQALGRRLGERLGKRLVVQAQVDPAIIGGLVVRVGDQLLDGSTRTRLELLKKDLALGGPDLRGQATQGR